MMNPLRSLAVRALRPELAAIAESNRQLAETAGYFKEQLSQLELAIEDQGWHRLMFGSRDEFSREGLARIIEFSRLMFLKNPLIRRSVLLQGLYVFGQGVTIKGEDDDVDAVVQDYLGSRQNRMELTSHAALLDKEHELQNTGNLFLVHFVAPDTGRVTTRSIPVGQISEVMTNPEDDKEPWYYLRVWQRAGREEKLLYRAWTSDEKAAEYKHIPVDAAAVVQHVKVGGTPWMRFGVPELYAAFDWATASRQFLETAKTYADSLAAFAWEIKTPGGQSGVDAIKSKLGSTLGSRPGLDTNPPPVVGSAVITGKGGETKPMDIGGKGIDPEQVRRYMLMVAAAAGLPETFYGDADVGNHATSKTLDRPTELKMASRQMLWRQDVLGPLYDFVVQQSLRAPAGKLKPLAAQVDDDGWMEMQDDPVTGEPRSQVVSIEFPPILEDDVAVTMKAIVDGATLGGQPIGPHMDPITVTRKILAALQVQDAETVIERIFPGGEVPEDFWQPPQPQTQGQPQNVQASARSTLIGAVTKLTEAVRNGR